MFRFRFSVALRPETIRTIRHGEPRAATSTVTQLLSSGVRLYLWSVEFICTLYNNKNIPYLSQREIKAVVRSHNEEHISIILSHETLAHTHSTLRQTPPFSQSAYTKSKHKITWNNAFSVKPKSKNFQIKYKS